MDQEQMRVAATKAVNDLDENASRKLAFIAALAGWTDVVRDATVRAVLVGSHDVQTFWLGECRCHGSDPQIKIAVGRPVTLQMEILEMLQKNPDVPMPPIYPGSIVVLCDKCGTRTYQGPRIQEAKQANPDLLFMCHLCGMLELADAADEGELGSVSISDLGNTYDPKPRS
jgi:hypothetical protein